MEHQQTHIIEVIQSLKENQQALRNLEFTAAREYGELFWLNIDFHSSNIAALMERHNADINYYLHQCTSSINLN